MFIISFSFFIYDFDFLFSMLFDFLFMVFTAIFLEDFMGSISFTDHDYWAFII